jgi:hypothetical protein
MTYVMWATFSALLWLETDSPLWLFSMLLWLTSAVLSRSFLKP